MKKNFFKKLASGLALAMVVTSFAPAAPALAATATKIVKQGGAKAPTTVYVGKKVDYSLNKVYGTNSYKWFTSNAAVAKVTKTGGVVTPVAPGKATVKVNAYKKSTGKFVKSFTLKLDVKQRATSVDIAAEDFELAVGETKDLNAVKTPATSTDTLRYFSSNDKVATVNVKTGLVKAVAAGEATIKVASKGAWFTSNTSKYNKYDEVKVTVVDGLLKVDQKAADKLELTYSSDMEKVALKVTDFSIVRDETNRVLPVKSVSAKGKVVTVTTFERMADSKVYTVSHDGDKVQFTATDDVVASLSISPVTIPANEETKVLVSTVDSKGIVLGNYSLTNAAAGNITFEITTSQGYTSGEKLSLFAVGNTAKATATYHTYKYDTNGNELGAVKTEATITAVDKVADNISKHQYTVAKDAPNWNLAVNANTRLAIGDVNYRLHLRVTKSDNSLLDLSTYTFESSNADVLLVYDYSNGNAPGVQAVAEGAAFVLVKDAKGNVVLSLPITIVAKRVRGSIAVSTNNVSVSNTVAVLDTKTVKVTIKDQYGDVMDDEKINITNVEAINTVGKSVPTAAAVNANLASYISVDTDNVITFNGNTGVAIPAGTYTYRVTKGNHSQIIYVNVQQAVTDTTGLTPSFALVLDKNVVDTTFAKGDKIADRTVTVKVARQYKNVLYDYVTFSEEGTTDGDGGNITITKAGDAVTGSAITGDVLTFAALDTSGARFAKKSAGSYTITVKYNDGGRVIPLTGGFVVTDNQSPVSFKRSDIVKAEGSWTNAQAVNEYFTFYYEGYQLNGANGNGTVTAADIVANPTTIQADGQRYFGTITVYVQVAAENGTFVRVPVKVNVNQTIKW